MPLRRTPAPTTRDTHAVAPEDFVPFDTPSTAELLQVDDTAPEVQPVPVQLVNKVRVDQLPTEMGILKSINVSSTEPEQILPENKRRATVSLWVPIGETVRIGRTPDEARRDDSAVILTTNLGVYRAHWTDACYAMKRAAGVDTDRLSVATEDYAR